jgi:predicted transglutaminase-like cysteine proteinase
MNFTLTKRQCLNALLLASLLLSALAWCDYANRTQILAYAQKKYGSDGHERIADWYALIDELQAQTTEQKLKGVNRFFNAIRWMPDEEHWKMRDYWATPVELLGTDGGDCEDFAIAKYFSLMELGVEESKLRITYVIATRQNQAHMVLAYYATPDAEPLILDNLKDKIAPASDRGDLRPVYSFNGNGLWLAKERNSNLPSRNNNLATWQNVNQRILKEINTMQAFFLLSPYWLRRRNWRRGE